MRDFNNRWRRYAIVMLAAVAVCMSLPVHVQAQSGPDKRRGGRAELGLVPWPQSVQRLHGAMAVTAGTRIVSTDQSLNRLAKILADELHQLTGLTPVVVTASADDTSGGSGGGASGAGGIVLRLARTLNDRRYTLRVTDQAVVKGGSYDAVAMGTVTLLQLLTRQGGDIHIPGIYVNDAPHFKYLGTMLDIARKPYSIATLEQCVEVCRFYKIHYIQLHMSDENAWTFPSKAFPEAGSTNYAWAGGDKPTVYDPAALKELVSYAAARGVVFVPELESPGHSSALRGSLPDIFGYHDDQGKLVNSGVTNVVSPKAMAAIDTIVGEMADVFHTSPYIHMGCDESSFGGIDKIPEVQRYMAAHHLKSIGELFDDYVTRLDGIVKKHGKRMIIWQGPPYGPGKLPTDVIFMPWVGGSGAAASMVHDGYAVINAPWGTSKRYFDPYNLNGAQLRADEPLLMGAISILWQSPQTAAVPYLRFEGALRNEPTYNPTSGKNYRDFLMRMGRTDVKLDRLLNGFTLAAKGTIPPETELTLAPLFGEEARLTLERGPSRGTIRYTLDGTAPTAASPVLDKPIRLTKTTTVSAQRFDADGRAMGMPLTRTYHRIQQVNNAAHGAKVTVSRPVSASYTGPDVPGLVDGILAAGNTYVSAGWAGWQSAQPVIFTIDLGRAMRLKTVRPHFLRSAGGVDIPKQVRIELSRDGRRFVPAATLDHEIGYKHRGWFAAALKGASARYVRVAVTPGGEWTFSDEILVNGETPGPTIHDAAFGKAVTLADESKAHYNAPGAQGLTDGYVSAKPNFLSLEWVGMQSSNMDITVDMGRPTRISRVGGIFLQGVWAGIGMPTQLDIFVADDGKTFRQVATVKRPGDQRSKYTERVIAKLPQPVRARYVRMLVHRGNQWTFIDEMLVNPQDGD